jgi:tetratricopeptide (TPR) repeat protein
LEDGSRDMKRKKDLSANNIIDLEQWYHQLLLENRNKSYIDTIRIRLMLEELDPERYAIEILLFREFRRTGMYSEAKEVIDGIIERHSHEIFPRVWLAELYLSFLDNPVKALKIIESAVVLAGEQGVLQRYVWGVRARIAVKLNRYDLLEECLSRLLDLSRTANEKDVGLEVDFFTHADHTRLSKSIVEQFKKLNAQG